jgi:hypothetical protein
VVLQDDEDNEALGFRWEDKELIDFARLLSLISLQESAAIETKGPEQGDDEW